MNGAAHYGSVEHSPSAATGAIDLNDADDDIIELLRVLAALIGPRSEEWIAELGDETTTAKPSAPSASVVQR